MKYYIGLGGIGCRVLNHYMESRKLPEQAFFFLDSDAAAAVQLPGRQLYIVPGLTQGTLALRNIGRSAVRREIYLGNLKAFFAPVFQDPEPQLIIVTSSFGGFGGAAATEIMDYLEANIWGREKAICQVYALTEKHLRAAGFPRPTIDILEANTLDFLSEFAGRMMRKGAEEAFPKHVFISRCRLWLVDTSMLAGEETWPDILDLEEEQLRKLDIKRGYHVRAISEAPDVFISYSFRDQAIADRIVDSLERKDVRCWIASRDVKEGSYPTQIQQQIRQVKVFFLLVSRNSVHSQQVKSELNRAHKRLNDGLIIVPFLVDDTELDDDMDYFLCMQEMFFGRNPPLEERISEIANRVREMLT